MPNPYINRVDIRRGNTTETLINIGDTTAVASDVASGKYFYLATGEKVVGTSSGGGTGGVTQDANGFLVLDDDPAAGPTLITKSITANGTYYASSDSADGYSSVTVNVSGSGGLVYETGTWTPTEDIVRPEIMFSNSHIDMPMFVMLTDVNGDYYSTTYSNLMFLYADWEGVFGYPFYVSSTGPQYCIAYNRYRPSNTTSTTASLHMLLSPSSDTSDSSSSYPRYYVKPDRFYPWSTDSAYWRTGRTYKWIAVWKPTS